MKQQRLVRRGAFVALMAVAAAAGLRERAARADNPLLGLGHPSAADSAAPAQVDAKADTVIRAMIAYGRSLQSFRVDVGHHLTMRVSGQAIDQSASWTIAVEQPSRLALRQVEGSTGRSVVSDGTHLWFYVSTAQTRCYAERDAPATVADIVTLPDWAVGGAEESMVAEWFLASDAYARLMRGMSRVQYVGREDLDGVSCDRIHFVQPDRDWDLWIEAGSRPLPRQLVPDLAASIARLAAQDPRYRDLTGSSTTDFRSWAVNERFSPEVFAYTPPPRTPQVPSIATALAALAAPPADTVPALGKPAPAFQLSGLDGKPVSLADYRGKNVVVLDFWATWCGPCRMSLPILAAVAKDYAAKGVRVYAVDLRESPEQVSAFLEAQHLPLSVLLDSNGAVGLAYGAERIPHTVIIGRDGMVKAVHNGYAPDLHDRFSRELDAVLAGRDPTGGG